MDEKTRANASYLQTIMRSPAVCGFVLCGLLCLFYMANNCDILKSTALLLVRYKLF